MEKSSAGTATPAGGKKSTQTTHLKVRKNELVRESTSDGSAASGVKIAY